ncbi:PilZ domain-containing protein [Sphingomonas sp. KC8]|uniref:PilZ domain-containing protein n=1 Tax=Sphingomonas sp. KC8 TaxID=1030157 RepID=UPI000248BB9A|nr:PilZ domain-containing protein [Sphingomonas sp. KC8]ARS28498.1 type IV pilus assembly PilZ [Sphingomonas sp. KC8]
MSLAAKLRQIFDDEERRSTRTRLRLDAGVRHGDQPFSEITVHDLSATGFRAESTADLSPGMIVEIDLPGIGVRDAEVMWAGHPYAGCAFREPLLREQICAALDASPVVWGEFGAPDDNLSALSRSNHTYFNDVVELTATPEAAPAPAIEKLPLQQRMLAILGLNSLLWAAIVAVAAGLWIFIA